jgi:hypothetical protein
VRRSKKGEVGWNSGLDSQAGGLNRYVRVFAVDGVGCSWSTGS